MSEPQPQQACIDVSVRTMPEPSILVAMPRWAAPVMPMTLPVYYEDAPAPRTGAVPPSRIQPTPPPPPAEPLHPSGAQVRAGDQAARLRALMVEASSESTEAAPSHAPPAWSPPSHIQPDLGQADPLPARAPASPRRESQPRRVGAVVAIASGKGGVGKTSIAVNLGIALSKAGHSTALLDADIGTANADLLCGVSPRARLDSVLAAPPIGSSEVDDPFVPSLSPPRRLADIAVEAPHGLRLVPGASGLSRLSDLSEDQRYRLLEALNEADDLADVLLVDLGAGIGSNVTALAGTADLCLVVATPDPTSMADAYALIKSLYHASPGRADDRARMQHPVPPIGLVVNQARDEREAREVARRVGSVCERFLCLPVPMYGWLAQDRRVAQSVRERTPWIVSDPASTPSKSIVAIAEVLERRLELRATTNTTTERGSIPARSNPGRGASGIRSWIWRAFVRASRPEPARR